MSRRSFSNHLELVTIINECRAQADWNGVRALVVTQMTPQNWLQQFASDFSAPFIELGTTSDRSDQVTSLLGTEHSILIHQSLQIFDAGLFAAASGTIKAGGVLILGTCHTDSSHFTQRFHRILDLLCERHADIVVKALFTPATGSLQRAQKSTLESAVLKSTPTSTTNSTPERAEQEQDQLYSLACKFLNQHKRACVLITGRRGRGKSTLMARLANWLNYNDLDYSLTAANQAGLWTVYQHSHSARAAFISTDNANQPLTSRLLVDEAGSLSLATLHSYLEKYEQLVFCTTVEGYESGGRAFDIRFAPQVRNTHPHVLDLKPVEPWRWASTDPLELLLDQLLLTDQASLTDELAQMAPRGFDPADTRSIPRLIDQTELASDEHRLQSLFSLFRNTHYQTSTQDLQHLLDSPDIQVWIVEKEHMIIAAVLLTLEGQIDAELHEAIVSKQRRLPHQLLPQLLAQSANTLDALAIKYARIIRISVTESMRRSGIASQLIQCIETHPGNNQIRNSQINTTAIGASFASDAASIAFWQANGYTEFHRGFKANPRTGKNAVAMIKAHSAAAIDIVDFAALIHADNSKARKLIARMSVDAAGIAHNDALEFSCEPRHFDYPLLRRFAANQRSANDTLGPLYRLAKRHDFTLRKHADQNQRHYEKSLRETVAALLANWP